MKLLVTCPGKMGDLLYSLPLVMQLKKKFACDVYLSTSTYCAPVINLLNAQPYIKKAFIDPGYRIAHTEFCVQPWRMSEPSGYDKIFHLGLREELVSEEVMKQHLIESFFLNMER
ncbi:MAG: glycosyltransferase family 9 protein, partial [bacterium]|nr:glycosyltransferase family 9 protein [bacterium]